MSESYIYIHKSIVDGLWMAYTIIRFITIDIPLCVQHATVLLSEKYPADNSQ